jgi:hypothetical protein
LSPGEEAGEMAMSGAGRAGSGYHLSIAPEGTGTCTS